MPNKTTKNMKPLSEARDLDVRHVEAALKRASESARRLAEQTHTHLVIVNKRNSTLGNEQTVQN
ncbi:MAG: hypothetical protein ABL923_07930 [Burkholderiaceae bacterium]